MSPQSCEPRANPRKTQTIRMLGPVNCSALAAAVRALPESVWQAENTAKPNKFEALDATSHIVLRFIDGPLDWRTSHDRASWPQWRALVEPVLATAVCDYGYDRGVYPRVMLARMRPGGVIHPHIDANPAAKWPHKIHVPLVTNPDVVCFFGGQERHFRCGEAVEVNNLAPHWVRNGGDTDRVHLIFEYFDADQPDPEWLSLLLALSTAR